MGYDLTDRLDAATKAAQQQNSTKVLKPAASPPDRIDAAIAAPPTLGSAPFARSEPTGTLTNAAAAGLTVDPFGPDKAKVGSGLAEIAPPFSSIKPGNGTDQNGVITADSAKAAMAAPMERSGGIAGGIDMKGANAVLARENATRQQMIDAQVGGGTGKPVSWQDQHGNADPEKERIADSNALLNKWDKQYQNQQAVAEMGRNPRAAQAIANIATAAGHDETVTRGQDLNFGATMAQQGITARGQDLNNQRAAAHDQVIMRGQDISGGIDAKRLGIDQSRLGIQQADSARADAKWGVESGILKGQAADSEAVRSARQGLMDATNIGDPKGIEAARNKAIAAGITFPKNESPSSSYTPNQAGMPGGMAVTKNPDGSMVLVPVDSKGKPGSPSVISGKHPSGASAQSAAPAAAVEFLKQNPQQATAFKAKYGYLPEGL